MKCICVLIFSSVLLDGCSMNFVPTHLTPVKAYGEDWTKPNMTRSSWQRDWVACGGMSNGQYSDDEPPGTTDAVSSILWKQKHKKLNACMKAKGYTYHYTGV